MSVKVKTGGAGGLSMASEGLPRRLELSPQLEKREESMEECFDIYPFLRNI